MTAMKATTCIHCGTRLVNNKCSVKHCKGFDRPAGQVEALAMGFLPFGQSMTAMGIRGIRS